MSAVPGAVLREMMRVANRVHRPSRIGKGMPVKPLSKDDFPADCFPAITSCKDVIFCHFTTLSGGILEEDQGPGLLHIVSTRRWR
jgi:hypothetical protein